MFKRFLTAMVLRGAALLTILLVSGLRAAPAAERVVAAWSFTNTQHGWKAAQQLDHVAVTNGALTFRATGADPILACEQPLPFVTSPHQAIEIRLKADRDGRAVFFWSNTAEGKHGGFTEAKKTGFSVVGDQRWHDYRLLPFWQTEGKIIRLRFDPYDQATFALASIRIVELPRPAPASSADFDFTRGSQGWTAWSGCVQAPEPEPGTASTPAYAAARFRAPAKVGPEGIVLTATRRDTFLLGPPVRLPAASHGYVSLRFSQDQGERAGLLFATDGMAGWHRLSFPVPADSADRTYTLDMRSDPRWKGTIVAVGLCLAEAPGANVRLGRLVLGDRPQGEPQLKIESFALETTLPRPGRPATLTAVLANNGGEPATNALAQLVLPRGVQQLGVTPNDGRVALLPFGERALVRWTIQAAEPLDNEAELSLFSANTRTVASRAPVRFTAKPGVPASRYVPEPKPVRGPGEVGVYYFPGWNTPDRWAKIEPFPERKPALGWYREGDPEVADWHIKWAVEHGITFFAYDWYWDRGSRHLEHGLHDGYFQARYRHLLKFCLLWANHNPPGSSSHDDCLAVTRHWITNYFQRPEHLTVDGLPVVLIFSPGRLRDDLGSDGVKKAFDAMRAECRQAGLKGLCLMACVSSGDQALQAAAEGYDAVTAYNWPGLGRQGDDKYAPFETLVDGYRQNWERILETTPLPFLLPVSGGWDSRPWHGDRNLVRFGRAPHLFRRHLLEAKTMLEAGRGPQSAPAFYRNAILIEAWNEWGEGSYIEPHSEFGFDYLDAIREVFTAAPKTHLDVTPADVGRGPYDLPLPESKTSRPAHN